MKTKNFLLTGALLIVALFSVNGVMAQDNATTTSEVKVSLIFNPIQSIQVNPNQKEINFEYDSPEDYATGAIDNKTQTLEDHLTVYHSGGFKVSVTSTGFRSGGTGDPISDEHVKVIAAKGSTIAEGRDNFNFDNTPSLTAGTHDFFSSTGGGMGLTFDVTYEHDGWESEDTYIDFTNGTTASTYTADVTYTIVSQ
jgi:hypothetical protein